MRSAYLDGYKGHYLTYFQGYKPFSDFSLSPKLQNDGAELFTRFFFGVHMAYRRFGFKYPIYNIIIDTQEEAEYGAIGVNHTDNTYTVRASWLRRVLETIQEKGQCSLKGGGFKEWIPAGDFLEIMGVEEAAHLMLYKEKKGNLGKSAVEEAEAEYKYHTSDRESRALNWKLAYVRRYFPRYYNTLKQTTEKVREIRRISTGG